MTSEFKPEMVPKVVAQILLRRPGNWTAEETIAAALSAWPGAFLYPLNKTRLILPLPQETRE